MLPVASGSANALRDDAPLPSTGAPGAGRPASAVREDDPPPHGVGTKMQRRPSRRAGDNRGSRDGKERVRRAGKREQDDERAKEHWVEKDDAAKGCCGGVGDSGDRLHTCS